MQTEPIAGFRLSPQQRRLWSLQQANQKMPRRAHVVVLIEGPLNTLALERAVGEVVERHEILRTRFYRLDGLEFPVQIINDDGMPAIHSLRLDDVQPNDVEHACETLLRRASAHETNGEEEPVLRFAIASLSSSKHLLHADLHSLSTDAEGLNALVHEIARCYETSSGADGQAEGDDQANGDGEAGELMQYADLSESFNQLAESGDAAAESWSAPDLSTALGLKLPFESESKVRHDFEPGVFEHHLPEALTEKISASAVAAGVDAPLFFLACWYLLLWKLTQKPEITASFTVDGRAFYGLADLPGLFSYTVPVQCRFDNVLKFADVLRQLKLASDEAKETQPNFNFENLPFAFEFSACASAFEAGGLKWTCCKQRVFTEQFTLKLRCSSNGSTCTEFHYNRNKLRGDVVERIARYYQHLLAGAVAGDKNVRVQKLEILDDSDRRRLLSDFNDTRETYSIDLCLQQPFEERAAAAPEAVALRFRSESLSYSELDRRAWSIARLLLALDIPVDSTIAVLCRRSMAMPAALLGVLKAGAAYVPLDPDYPIERLRFMISDSGARALVAEPELAEQLGTQLGKDGLPLISLPDTDAAWTEAENASLSYQINSFPAVGPDNLAYVIYTSGSTGKPKGVMVTHRGAVNCLQWMQQSYKLGASDSFLFKTSLGFDPSVWELFWPLWVGARCVIAEPDGQSDPAYLLRLIAEEKVTSAYFVPSLLSQVVEAEELEEAGRSLRRVICGGEVLPVDVMRQFMRRVPGAELRHSYGPTETSIAATEWKCKTAARRALMGQPLGNVKVYVLDARMELLPEGVAGELYIGGEGVARGYCGRQALTAERFVPEPFSNEPGARLYKTGDVVRWTSDGALEYLGRDDGQVKVRGYRIETGEVEAALRRHVAVKEAVVVLREIADGEKQLVSYLICSEGQAPRVEELREHLQQHVPNYMVPQAFVVLKELPLMVNGKVDKNALPAPDEVMRSGDGSHAAPRNEAEEVLAAIWSHVLGVENVGVDDNFFDLGGDSIRSVRVVAMAKERGLRLTVQQLFRSQTIAALVREHDLRERREVESPATKPFSLISLEDRERLPADVEDAYPLSMMQTAMLYHMEMTPESRAYVNVNSWYLRAPFDDEALREAMRQVVGRHPILRTSFVLTSYSKPLQLVHRHAEVPLEVHDIRYLSPDEQEEVVQEFLRELRRQMFDFSRPLQMSFYIHQRTDDSFQFSLAENHAILDGWSTTSTLVEFAERYIALLAGEQTPGQLPPAVSYRDFINLELSALASEETQQYWAEQLRDATPVRLPYVAQRAVPLNGQRVEKLQLYLDDEVYEGLRRVARTLAVPLKTVAFTAHLKVMSMLSGQTDLLAGITTNGRPEESGGTQVRGNFLNTVPFRFKFTGGTWAETIRRVFDAEWAMLPHRRYPLGALQKSWGREPLLETSFAFLHFHSVDDMLRTGKVEIIDDKAIDLSETSFPILTHFDINSTSLNKNAWMDVQFDVTRTSPELRAAVLGYYDRVLRSIAADISARHEADNYLSDIERGRLLVTWNKTESRPSACLHELFEAQVARTPDAEAVACGDERLSYGELNNRADRLANRLRALGVGPEVLVAVMLERSTDMLVALLGVLKSGGAYVPLDSANPRERLAFIIEDAAAPVLLTQQRFLADLLPHPAHVICVDVDVDETTSKEQTERKIVAPDNTAYVIYTSGSTGKPKGVLVTHGGLSNYLSWCASAYQTGEGTGALVHSSISFDLTITGLFAPLLTGGRVVFAPEGVGIEQLTQTLKEQEDLSLIKITPAQLQLLSRQLTPAEAMGRTRRFVTGGENLQAEILRFWQDASPETIHINEYGPTETVVGCCVYEVPKDERLSGSVPIGRPIANTQLYVLDSFLQPVPTEVAGELYIGGAGVARGYLNHPALTAERFIPDRFGSKPGGRLYRTGDLVRYRMDGQLEFLGRLDDQLKIHGYRVETEEIALTLKQHSSLRDAFVTAIQDTNGDKRVVAYLIARGQELSVTELRVFLKEKLPEYMIPSAFVWLNDLPLTAAGKVDRRALPEPGVLRPQLTTSYVAPQGETEELIAALWREVLQVETVGVHDNFFDLGGDSFGVYELYSKVCELLGCRLSILDLFKYPTVKALAAHIKSLGEKQPVRQSLEETEKRALKHQQANSRRRQLTMDRAAKANVQK